MSNISDNSEHKQDRIKQLKLIKKLTNDNRINSSADMAVNGIWVFRMRIICIDQLNLDIEKHQTEPSGLLPQIDSKESFDPYK